jgi:prepilin-type N-terminal cleavage/methylation domain-containing protein
MKINHKGFTLLELLLTIGIVGMIGLVLFQSTGYSMNVLRRTNSRVNSQALMIMRQIGRDLRGAFLMSKKYPEISFLGTASSMKFISTAPLNDRFDGPNEFDLKEKHYYLAPGDEGQKPVFMCAMRNFSEPTAPEDKIEGQPGTRQALSAFVDSLNFSYFDGREWLPMWNSLEQLPESVRITIQFREDGPKNQLEYFSTVIMLPGA